MRTLSRIAILSVFTPFLFGQMCGAPGPVEQPNPGRLEINDSLRSACSAFQATDGELAVFIADFEADRVAGYQKGYVVQQVINVACYDPEDPTLWNACNVCGIAVINQVYGE